MNFKKALISFFLFFIIPVAATKAQEYQYKFKYFSVDEGLAHTDATSLIQDQDGFIWVGTFNGLNKFNGYDFEHFKDTRTQLSAAYTNRIMHMAYDGQLLFMGTQGGVVCFDTFTEKYVKLSLNNHEFDVLSNLKVFQVAITKNQLFFTANQQVYVYNYNYVGGVLKLKEINITTKFNEPFSVEQVYIDNQESIWVSGATGLYILSEEKKLDTFYLEKISVVNQNNKDVKNLNSTYLFHDNLWLGGVNTLTKLNLTTLKNNRVEAFTYFEFPLAARRGLEVSEDKNFEVTNITKLKNGNFWLGTTIGLIEFQQDGEELKYNSFYSKSYGESKEKLSDSRISCLLSDSNDNLWISIFGGGVNFIDFNQKKFYLLSHSAKSNNTLVSNYVRAIKEDDDGNLWIGTMDKGISFYDFKTNQYTTFRHEDNNPNSIISDAVRSLTFDNKGRLWVGTFDGISVVGLKKMSFKHLTDELQNERSLTSYNIFDIAQDTFGNIWAGSWNAGLNKIVEYNNGFKVEKYYSNSDLSISSDGITSIYADKKRPELFVSTNYGLNHIFLDSKGEVKEIKQYLGVHGNSNLLTSNFVWPVERVNDSLLWVGTLGGGLNKMILNEESSFGYYVEKISNDSDFVFSDIETLLVDDEQNVWMGGNGLFKFEPETNKIIRYGVEDGLQGNSFKIGAAHKGKSGRFYFGGTKGITYFYPNEIKTDTSTYTTVLTKLSVNNEDVKIGETYNKEIILNKHINKSDVLNLNYLQNNFTISFSSLEFVNPSNAKYKYILEGYNEDWIEIEGSLPMATFGNLDYGDYKFKVMSANASGIWSSAIKELPLIISPPWWLSVFAKVVYALFVLALLYATFRWMVLKRAYDVSVIEKKQEEQLNKLRLQFFTNISHDFRTPLTLIINPLEDLVKGTVGKRKRLRYYSHMLNNTKRLLRLVNELMDFQKIETKAYELQLQKGNINSVIKDVCESFEEYANSRDIYFNYNLSETFENFWFDKTVIEKILYNLLGNAFKFTKNGGRVKVDLLKSIRTDELSQKNSFRIWNQDSKKNYVWIKITDSGVGISEDEIKHIFTRFFHKNNDALLDSEGSGVGLSLVKSLVTLHEGSVLVTSEENKGASFYVSVPYNLNEVSVEVNNNIKLSKSSLSPIYDQPNIIFGARESLGKSSILVVEDNQELRFFIKENFEDEFYVLEAEDGMEALSKIKTFKPNLIISDVMMPRMDGIELCKRVKELEGCNDIPFVLLTSNLSLEKQLEAANAKADLYLSKPFSIDVLKVSIQNIISNRRKIKTDIVKNTFEEAHSMASNAKENEFLQKVTKIVMDNIDDNAFDVNTLSEKLGMSRTKLYTKVKDLTGKPTGELIRKIRVKKAASLLASEDITVAQAMYKVGIQSKSYFSKVFRKEYGKTPSQFLQDLSKKS